MRKRNQRLPTVFVLVIPYSIEILNLERFDSCNKAKRLSFSIQNLDFSRAILFFEAPHCLVLQLLKRKHKY